MAWADAPYWYGAEYGMLALALLLNGWSLKRYYQYFIEQYMRIHQKNH
jgi:hypothetical protein